MNRQLLRRLSLLFSFVALLTISGRAQFNDALAGGDIGYRVTAGGDSIEVSINFYVDCSASNPAGSFTLIRRLCSGAGVTTLASINSAIPDETVEVSDLCSSTTTTCGVGTAPGRERRTYIRTFELATWTASCYRLQVRPADRNSSVNLSSATTQTLYLQAEVYLDNGPTNTSPVFNATPIPTIDASSTVNFDPQVTDAENDSLVFNLVGAAGGTGATPTTLTYNGGFSAAAPISGITMNSQTGVLSFTSPATTGNYQVAIEVLEYDAATGNQLSRTVRDFQFVVRSGTNNGPAAAASLSGLTGATLNSSYEVTLTVGTAACFTLEFTDADDVTINDTVATTELPSATITTTTGTTAEAEICWTPVLADVGTYVVSLSARDDACPESGYGAQSITIHVSETPQAFFVDSVITTNESCPDVNDGTVTIYFSGGTGPFNFAVIPDGTTDSIFNTAGTFTDLDPGIYSWWAIDSSDMSDTTDFNLTVLANNFGFSGTRFTINSQVTCNNACDGSVRINPNTQGAGGNVTLYTYQWSNGGTTRTSTTVCGGLSYVTVTDTVGCEIIDSINLREPPAIWAEVDSTDSASCAGAADGYAEISGHGGTASSSSTAAYLIDQSEGSFEPYGFGNSFNVSNYQTVSLTDESLSSAISMGFTFNFFGNNKTDFRLHGNGYLTFNTTVPGTNWVQSAIPSTLQQEDWIGIWEDLNPGAGGTVETYLIGSSPNRVRVVNFIDVPFFENGSQTATYQYALYENSNIIQIYSIDVPALASGTEDGLIKVMGIENSAGTIAYSPSGRNGTNWSATNDYVAFVPETQNFSTFTWSSIGSGSSSSALTAGTYTVSIGTSASCNDTVSFTILEPDAIVIDTTTTSPTCAGDNDGQIAVTTSGGTGVITLLWNTGSTAATITNLAAGTYTVTATDANGCTETMTILLNDPAAVTVSATPTDVLCFGQSTGSITATGAGGNSGVFTYTWSNAATGATITNLAAATYTVTATDADGCSATTTAVVAQPASAVSASISASSDETCAGADDGTATAAGSGGTSPYTFLWSNGTAVAANTGLSAATYTVTVTDDNGCTATTTVAIAAAGATVTATAIEDEPVSCFGDNDGEASASAIGGTGTYTFAWSNGGTGNAITGLTAGTYTVTATDGNGCEGVDNVSITEPAASLSTTATATDASCNGATDGSATASPSGGTSPYTYLWTGGQTGQTATNLAAGTYTVTVTDDNGCTATASDAVANPTAVSVSITPTQPSCSGGTGSALAAGSGGTGTIDYLWSNGAATANNTALVAGTYTVTATDDNGCTATASTTITAATAITVSIATSTQVSCFGGSDGSATASGSGGTGTYTYAWSNAASGATASSLVAGTYTVTATDGNGCTGTVSTTISQPAAAMTASIAGTDALCNGGSTGTATASTANGTSPITFLWSNTSTSNPQTTLAAGTYTVTATDDNGCTATATVLIDEPDMLIAFTSVSAAPTCATSTDGAVQANQIGGTSPFTYLWNNGSTSSLNSGLMAGTYTVTVTDDNGCTDTEDETLSAPNPLVLTGDGVDESCSGAGDGLATVAISGGTAPYTYLWSTGSTSDTISTLTAGTYTVTITDDNGCTDTEVIVISSGSGATVSLAPSNPACAGTATGSIAATAGGSSPFNYSWAGTTQTTATVTSLTAGTYTVTVTDNNGCTATASTTLSNPTAITLSATPTSGTCGTGGSATASASGGTGTLDLLWSTGSTSATITGLIAGTYTVTATDDNGCTATATAVVTTGTSLSLSATNTSVLCFGGSTGTATAVPTGGTGTITYAWSNAATGITITNLAAATYTVTATDGAGCTATASTTVSAPASAVTASITGTTNPECEGGTDGSIVSSGSGGTAPLTYLWSNGSTSSTASSLAAGTYTVTVTDNNGCTATASATLGDGTSIALVVTSTNSFCIFCTGTASATPSGGQTPYSYLWSNGSTSQNLSSLCSDPYAVTVTDANGCTATGGTVVSDFFTPTLNTSATDANCFDVCDGQAVTTYTCGTCDPIEWFEFPDTTAFLGNGDTLFNVCADTLLVRLTTAFGCERYDTVVVNEPTELVAAITSTNATCASGTGSATASASGGTSPYDFEWNTGATTAAITSLTAGTYTVVVTDDNNCTDTLSVVITSSSTMTASIASTQDVLCNGATTGSATATNSGGSGTVTYAWSNAATGATASNLAAGTYTVTATDALGCTASAIATIDEETAIDPNASGTNPTCAAGTDGEATAAPTGGVAPYDYAWTGGQTSQTATGLVAGTYTVTVTDDNGCTEEESVVLSDPAAFTVNVSSSGVACAGDSSGSATAVPTGGQSPITYLWSTGTVGITEPALPSGTFTVTATDNNGCTATDDVTIVVAPGITFTGFSNISNVSCDDECDGAATAAASGGSGTLTYTWSSGSTGTTASNLCGGGQQVTITDTAGCSAVALLSLVEPPAFWLEEDSIGISCAGGSDGYISVTALGGQSPFVNTTNYIVDTLQGSYEPYTLGEPANAQNFQVLSLADDAVSAVLDVFDGDSSFSFFGIDYTRFVITSQGFISFDTTNANSGQVNGLYSVPATMPAAALPNAFIAGFWEDLDPSVGVAEINTYVLGTAPNRVRVVNYMNIDHFFNGTVGSGDTSTFQIVLHEQSGVIQIFGEQLDDDGGNHVQGIENATGTAFFGANGRNNAAFSAVSDYIAFVPETTPTFMWSNGATGPSISGITAGSYTVTATNVGGCTASLSLNLSSSSAVAAAITNSDVFCFGASTATASASATGGTGPYTFLWSTGSTATTIALLPAGTYTVTATDDLGCTDTAQVIINQPASIVSVSIGSVVQNTCLGGDDGEALATASGGFGAFTFLWSNGDTDSLADGLTAGTYTVTATDGFGCTGTDTVIITEPATGLSVIFVDSVAASCFGGADASAAASAQGATASVSYAWSNGDNDSIASGLTAGTYTVTASQSSGGCTATASIVLGQAVALTFNVAITDAECNGGNTGAAASSAAGGTAPYTYLWNTGSTATGISALTAGTYTLSLTDDNGCSDDTAVIVSQPTPLAVSFGSLVASDCSACTGEATATASGGNGGYSFLWANSQTSATATGLCDGTTTVTVTDALGCNDDFTVSVPSDSADTVLAGATAASCSGVCDGQVFTTLSSAGATFVWIDLSSSATVGTTDTVSGLCAGSYLVQMTNTAGCVSTDTAVVSEPTPMLASAGGATAVSCFGGSDGTAAATAIGGTTPYDFLWSGGQVTALATGLSAGVHTVTVTDANGCTYTASISISQPSSGLSVAASLTQDVNCFGGNDGIVTASVSGGSGTVTFTWNGTLNGATQTGLTAGTYTVVATDGGSCAATDTITVSQPTAITAGIGAQTSTSCAGLSDGTAVAVGTGGTAPYSYLWSTGSVNDTVSGLSAGQYCVTVSDANGCNDTACVTISEPAAISNIFSAVTNSSCTVCDGTATATASGGTGGPYTYVWSNGEIGPVGDTLCAGFSQVTITDAGGCSIIEPIGIDADGADTVSASAINANCGQCDGQAVATYVCGTAPCTVQWTVFGSGTPVGTTDTVENLCAGTYAVALTNDAGCISTDTVTVTAPAVIDPQAVVNNASCAGFTDGSITLNPTGGDGSYDYNWSNGAGNTSSLSGLAAGFYTVTISDGVGCDTVAVFTVTAPAGIALNLVTTNATCADTCNGTAEAQAGGGNGSLTFSWSPIPGNGQGVQLATGLCAGQYIVTVSDQDGCTATDTAFITEPAPIVEITASVSDAECGVCDGAVTANLGGGTGAISLLWSNGDTSATNDSLCFGLYTLQATDANGCQREFAYPVSETNAPQFTLSTGNATAFGECDGSATLTVVSAQGSVTVVWSNGDTGLVADSLCAGSYSYTATDTAGCHAVDTFSITQPTALLVSVSATDLSCGGGCDGTVTAAVSGGETPYSFLWNTGDTTSALDSLCAGTYTVTVTDSNGATVVASAIVDEPQTFTLSASVQAASCPNVCDGAIALSITGGAQPTVLWNTGSTADTLVGLCAGTYSVTVTDTNGCSDTLSALVSEPPAIAVALLNQVEPGCQLFNGGMEVLASGGNGGPFDYLWLDVNFDTLLPVQTGPIVTGLFAGIYNVLVRDVNGCLDTAGFILNNDNAPDIALDTIVDVSCFGECDGRIEVSLSGGTTPYTVLWSSGGTAEDDTALCAGPDTLAVADSLFCLAFGIYEVGTPAAVGVDSLVASTLTCGSDCNGTIKAYANGGTAPYTYQWSTGATGDTLGGLCSGSYGLTITDAAGCTFSTVAVVAGPAPMILALDSAGDATCSYTADGYVYVSLSGGVAPYSFLWSNGSATITAEDLAGVPAGDYTLLVTDATGCTDADTFDLNAQYPVGVNAQGNFRVCPFSAGVEVEGTSTGATEVRWLSASGVVIGDGLSTTVNVITDTTLLVMEGINNGCVDRDTVLVTTSQGAGIDAGLDVTIEPGESVTIGGDPTANDGVEVEWSPASDLSSITDYNPEANPLESITYYVSGTDAEGCSGLDSIRVTVEKVIDPVDGFSPNGDGVNDGFYIAKIERYPEAVVTIYNRWGNLIFQSDAGYSTPWNGMYDGNVLPTGTYYYIVNLNDPVVTKPISGAVVILK